jgi:molybdate-binding protein
MKLSTIEITENEYLIKLSKENFDLAFINQLLKRIQSEVLFSSFKGASQEDDLMSRNIERGSYFSHLDEK